MWWLLALITLLLVAILAAVGAYASLLVRHDEPVAHPPLTRFDNSAVPLIEPPAEIVIEGNAHECHATPTPCTSHADCDLCREGLANCQYFAERAVIQLQNGDEHVVEPGDSYCLALNRERARSCNPNTGVWLLAETGAGFSLLCSCLTPGLVTQLNMYGDCDVAVGCQPSGRIVDLNERPLRCECEAGFASAFDDATQTPYCRPLRVRDVIYDTDFFHRAPCREGFVRVDHPALDQTYRQEFRLNDICVVDPCSIDPLTGFRIRGRLRHVRHQNNDYNFCECDLVQNVFGVYSDTGNGMVGESAVTAGTRAVTNACIQPFNQDLFGLRQLHYKRFWAREESAFSDDDVVAAVTPAQLMGRYKTIAYPFILTWPNPDQLWLTSFVLVKFSVAYAPPFAEGNNCDRLYRALEQNTSGHCFVPGTGRCVLINPNYCIRRHTGAQVWLAEIAHTCIFSRQGNHIRVWRNATDYSINRAPAVFFTNVTDLLPPTFGSLDFRPLYTITARDLMNTTTDNPELRALLLILDTYPRYKID
ncbi:PIF-1 [Olene mendosa nucleopolyhedrovirus]|uniref:PIF-1 n=1 Tax=Olene mendosa nucleopolyhedrovirus TaxID=2933796 RepID=A0AAX3AUF2_9ABAC|nr:PIF-1 [Olene mendosa nucleopolyhedrovirus]UOQ18921.1 PIF-1 [Olene mendosa nucleopolyhedrovirus]